MLMLLNEMTLMLISGVMIETLNKILPSNRHFQNISPKVDMERERFTTFL
jgi:hypothetical protein